MFTKIHTFSVVFFASVRKVWGFQSKERTVPLQKKRTVLPSLLFTAGLRIVIYTMSLNHLKRRQTGFRCL